VTLALALAFNSGAFARPTADDDGDDTALIQDQAPKGDHAESFGERMAKARAAKHKKGEGAAAPKHHRAKKVRTAKTPRIPKAPAIAQVGD
jgi:hypothetical protein